MTIILLIAAMQAGAAVPDRAAVQQAVEQLDMTSFNNSLNNAGGPGRRRLREFGAQRFAWSDGSLQVTEADGSWFRSFRPLRGPRGRIRLCFTDQAQNGGTYLAFSAIELRRGRDGLYRASEIRHADCAGYAR